MIDRRTFLAAAAAFAGRCSSVAAPPASADDSTADRLEAIRATLGPGGRLGVAAIVTGSGRRLVHDPDARYALASTFMLPLAAAVLAEVERGRIGLDEELKFEPGEPLDNSPVVKAHLRRGRLPVRRLCGAII